jgi:acetoin utilization deacetylase AcuC-like enzyme
MANEPPAVGLVWDDRLLQHDPGLMTLPSGEPLPYVEPTLHFSNYRVVHRTKELLDYSGLADRLIPVPARTATVAELTAFHSAEYVAHVRAVAAAGGGEAGWMTPVSRRSYDVAVMAAGGALAAVDAVCAGPLDRAFALVRPPGHHARRDEALGYCLFNNVALAALHARRAHGVERIAVVDWDVHAGNGTQEAFYADPRTLFVSLHQADLFLPERGYGALDQAGAGDAVGRTLNLPLSVGGGDAVYAAAFDEIVVPVLDRFEPELILVSAGQDASVRDPLGRMSVTTWGFRHMAQRLIACAQRHGGGRIVVVQEGGYSEDYAPYCAHAVIETLVGHRTGIAEPITAERIASQPHHRAVGPGGAADLRALREYHGRHWSVVRPPPGH